MNKLWLSGFLAALFFNLNCSGCDSEAYVVSNPPLLVVSTDILDFGKITTGLYGHEKKFSW